MPSPRHEQSVLEDEVSRDKMSRSTKVKRWPTETMLRAYFAMRGPASEHGGPLYAMNPHQPMPALSPASSGDIMPMPNRPYVQHVMQCSVVPLYQGQSHQPSLSQDHRNPVSNGEIESEALESYGYIKINGRWVDPDSEGSIYNASKGYSTGKSPPLPRTNHSSGPYILSKSEESAVYAEFTNDEDDDEGDPRDSRISPETFATWAEGATKGGYFEYKAVEEPVQMQRNHRRKRGERPKLTLKFVPQFDENTGEVLSPFYPKEEVPTPLWSPQGVDIDRCPSNFAYSYPLDDLHYKRGAFFDAHISNTSPALSGPERFTSGGIREALIINDPESGIHQSEEVRDYIHQLQQGRIIHATEAHKEAEVNDLLIKEVNRLGGNITLLLVQEKTLIEKARRRRRYNEQLKQYIEALTHGRDMAVRKAQHLHWSNEILREQAVRLLDEEQEVLKRIATLRAAEFFDHGGAAVDASRETG